MRPCQGSAPTNTAGPAPHTPASVSLSFQQESNVSEVDVAAGAFVEASPHRTHIVSEALAPSSSQAPWESTFSRHIMFVQPDAISILGESAPQGTRGNV